jgi:hypothetical protein
MQLFVHSAACMSKQKCHLCRDPRDASNFRATFATLFEMPGPGFFACPFGVDEGNPREPTDEEVERQRRALKQGGCCGAPSAGE